MKNPITVEVHQKDPNSGRMTSNIIMKFMDLSEFQSFYAEAKERNGIVHIMVRNYDIDEEEEKCDIYDSILINFKNQPVYLQKVEKR